MKKGKNSGFRHLIRKISTIFLVSDTFKSAVSVKKRKDTVPKFRWPPFKIKTKTSTRVTVNFLKVKEGDFLLPSAKAVFSSQGEAAVSFHISLQEDSISIQASRYCLPLEQWPHPSDTHRRLTDGPFFFLHSSIRFRIYLYCLFNHLLFLLSKYSVTSDIAVY
ncbi:hypothetical protein CDAR_47801 [Caerostris darwini]|uniref:Uncharacterized protein n=1 Tax=Caerostris darwini TaxID=1538125 RepID=A0AAV4M893_9ARAC|nr:hypothetical protein CDAR_47801 [Caerostris darwini]